MISLLFSDAGTYVLPVAHYVRIGGLFGNHYPALGTREGDNISLDFGF